MVSSCSGTPASNAISPTRAGSSASTTSKSPSTVTVSPARSSASRSWSGARRAHDHVPAGREPADRALVDELAAVDHHDVVDRLRHLGQHVAGDEHRAALGGHAAQEVAQPADALRIEAVGGLVEDQHLRVAEQRGGEPEPLAHAERVLAGAPARGARRARRACRTSSTRERGRPAIAASARRWSRPLRPGCAPATSRFAPTVRAGCVELHVRRAHHRRVARRRPREREDHPQRRRLAGAVGPEEPGHGGLADRERQVVDRDHRLRTASSAPPSRSPPRRRRLADALAARRSNRSAFTTAPPSRISASA